MYRQLDQPLFPLPDQAPGPHEADPVEYRRSNARQRNQAGTVALVMILYVIDIRRSHQHAEGASTNASPGQVFSGLVTHDKTSTASPLLHLAGCDLYPARSNRLSVAGEVWGASEPTDSVLSKVRRTEHPSAPEPSSPAYFRLRSIVSQAQSPCVIRTTWCSGIVRNMSLATGTRVGHYEILAPVSAGGMGGVYRARDPRLKTGRGAEGVA